jgi:hypothetical protein
MHLEFFNEYYVCDLNQVKKQKTWFFNQVFRQAIFEFTILTQPF